MTDPKKLIDEYAETWSDLAKHDGTHNTREWEKEFDEKFSAFTFNNGGALELTLWDVVDERIHPTNEVGFEIYNFIHHQLQKARHDWLREEIVKLEGMKKKGNDGKGLPFENSPEIYGNARMEAWKNGHNQALDDAIALIRTTLTQNSNQK